MNAVTKGFIQFQPFWNIPWCIVPTRKSNPIICPKKYLPNLIFENTQKQHESTQRRRIDSSCLNKNLVEKLKKEKKKQTLEEKTQLLASSLLLLQ